MIEHLVHSIIVCPDMDKQYPKITHGKGIYLFDETGKKYIDASSGAAAVANLGHGIEEIVSVMAAQAGRVSVTPTHAFNSGVVETYLADLVAFAPQGFSRAWTVTSGTEAAENAVKLALQYHQLKGNHHKYKVIARWGSYHGNSIFMLDVGGMKLRRETYGKWMNNFPHIPAAYSYRRPPDMSESAYAAESAAQLEKCLLETGPETVAAFIVEPVVAAALGAVPPPEGYFQEIRRVCTKYDVLLISDEVLTGFGRTGQPFAMSNFGVTPDIIAAGKGMSAGYFPLSAIIASGKVAEVFEQARKPFLGGHTFACNPVGAAVGSFVLKYMQEHQVIENARKMGDLFLHKLKRLYRHDVVGDVRGLGLMAGVELVSDRITKTPFSPDLKLAAKIGDKALEKGVVLYPGRGSADGFAGDHILITPPLIINEAQLDMIVDAFDESIAEITAGLDLKKTVALSNK